MAAESRTLLLLLARVYDRVRYYARNGHISTSGLKSYVTIVFRDPDFLEDAKILTIRLHLRQI